MTDREALAKLAIETVSAELYYDLTDNIENTPDSELIAIIACNGDYEKEMELAK